MTMLLYGHLTYELNGIFFAVHNELGRFAREKQCGDLFEKKLKEINIAYKREVRIGDSGNVIDFIIEDSIVIEFKAIPIVTRLEYYQVQRYLYATGLELGILVNFRDKFLQPKRILRKAELSHP